jgi:hypothetical protein
MSQESPQEPYINNTSDFLGDGHLLFAKIKMKKLVVN